MIKTEQKLQKAIKELALKQSLDDISVISLCSYLGIRRQTFYYHYKDVYDLIQSMFLDESHLILNYKFDREELKNYVIKYVKDNFDFLKIIASSNVSNVLMEFFYDIFYSEILRELLEFKISNSKKQMINRFVSTGISNEFLYQLSHLNEFTSSTFEGLLDFFFKNLDLNIKG